jgi:hypothetical protein
VVAGTLLYYGQAVGTTILTAISSIATKQTSPMVKTMKKVKQLLDYCASHEEAIITFKASDMILQVHSDAGYANEKNHKAAPAAIFSYRITTLPPPTMAQCIYTTYSLKWDIPNHAHPSRHITLLRRQ